MKRQTKFRGKRTDTGAWVTGYYVVTPLTDENSGTDPSAGWFFLTGETRHCIVQNHVCFTIVPETIGQYTGLSDRHGTEIYEDDILEGHSDGLVTVERSELDGGWDCVFEDEAAIGIAEMCVWFGNNATVVGNKHDKQ